MEKNTDLTLYVQGTEHWESSSLMDPKVVAAMLPFREEEAHHGMRKACKSFRFPTLKRPLYMVVSGESKAVELTPVGDTPRKRWRSLVVQCQKHRFHLRHQKQWQIVYQAELHVFDLHIRWVIKEDVTPTRLRTIVHPSSA